jgi:hypothetical protein
MKTPISRGSRPRAIRCRRSAAEKRANKRDGVAELPGLTPQGYTMSPLRGRERTLVLRGDHCLSVDLDIVLFLEPPKWGGIIKPGA